MVSSMPLEERVNYTGSLEDFPGLVFSPAPCSPLPFVFHRHNIDEWMIWWWQTNIKISIPLLCDRVNLSAKCSVLAYVFIQYKHLNNVICIRACKKLLWASRFQIHLPDRANKKRILSVEAQYMLAECTFPKKRPIIIAQKYPLFLFLGTNKTETVPNR